MKIESDSVFVMLKTENKYDIFQLGQLFGDMHKHGFKAHVMLPSGEEASPSGEESSFGKLSIKKEDFISYIIKKL